MLMIVEYKLRVEELQSEVLSSLPGKRTSWKGKQIFVAQRRAAYDDGVIFLQLGV